MTYSKSCLVSRRVRAVIPLCGLRYGAHPPCAQPWLDSVHNTENELQNAGYRRKFIKEISGHAHSGARQSTSSGILVRPCRNPSRNPSQNPSLFGSKMDPKWIQNGAQIHQKSIKKSIRFFYVLLSYFLSFFYGPDPSKVSSRLHESSFFIFFAFLFSMLFSFQNGSQNASKIHPKAFSNP